jgi:hypothetical protein
MVFGPFGRFKLVPEWHKGETIAFELWDAERPDAKGHSTKVRRFTWAADALEFAASLVEPQWREITSRGARIIPA